MLKEFKTVLSLGYKTMKYLIKSEMTGSMIRKGKYLAQMHYYEHKFNKATAKFDKEFDRKFNK